MWRWNLVVRTYIVHLGILDTSRMRKAKIKIFWYVKERFNIDLSRFNQYSNMHLVLHQEHH